MYSYTPMIAALKTEATRTSRRATCCEGSTQAVPVAQAWKLLDGPSHHPVKSQGRSSPRITRWQRERGTPRLTPTPSADCGQGTTSQMTPGRAAQIGRPAPVKSTATTRGQARPREGGGGEPEAGRAGRTRRPPPRQRQDQSQDEAVRPPGKGTRDGGCPPRGGWDATAPARKPNRLRSD